MIRAMLPDIFKIEIPLPNNPLKAINSYVIKGSERHLIIDTGMNRPECLQAIKSGLAELDVDLQNCDFFITHMHADHSGLVGTLATDDARVYMSPVDGNLLASGMPWPDILHSARAHGFPEHELQQVLAQHPGYCYATPKNLRFTPVDDGSTIAVGDYAFTCVATPGHTKGHLCLYEPAQKLLFSGDHILSKITPNIGSWQDGENPLAEYLESLHKVSKLEARLVLPSHRTPITDCLARINQLQSHHSARFQEVLSLLSTKPSNAYQIAARIHWDLSYKSWDQFPVAQKWFATGEAISHLVYLTRQGSVTQHISERDVCFSTA